MPSDCISYQDSGYFSPLMNDYLEQKENLKSLYNRFPTLENFGPQILEKQQNFNDNQRQILVSALEEQYKNLTVSSLTQQNIASLKAPNTFTITTGHQLNLFTGPLYFLYKIISVINLTKELKSEYPEYNFVPVYWMATEDHDFEEINYFNFKGKKIRWNRESSGPVGRLSTEGLDEVFECLEKELGIGTNAKYLKTLFTDAYLKHDNLATATHFLANALFGHYGLVVMNADESSLKRLFIPHIKEELSYQTANSCVAESTSLLSGYKIQVNPREINLFYIGGALRERIILKNDLYYINNTDLVFTQEEILRLVDEHPEHFSPNVIMRPLYQEVILPNLCYVGGGGELAYWLELKSYFDRSAVTFPILLLRNSALLASQKLAEKADKLNLSWADLFKKQSDLVNEKIRFYSTFTLDFTPQKKLLHEQFALLSEIASKTDDSFSGAVKAQETKQLKGLDNLEKKLVRAEKKKHADQLKRITELQNMLFPNNSLQERQANFSEFYLESGSHLIENLFTKLHPLSHDFTIIVVS